MAIPGTFWNSLETFFYREESYTFLGQKIGKFQWRRGNLLKKNWRWSHPHRLYLVWPFPLVIYLFPVPFVNICHPFLFFWIFLPPIYQNSVYLALESRQVQIFEFSQERWMNKANTSIFYVIIWKYFLRAE